MFVPRIFRTVGSPTGQPYAFISGSRTAPWKLIIYITKIPVNFAVSAHFIQCGEYLITYSKLAEPNEHEPNRTDICGSFKKPNTNRTRGMFCSVRLLVEHEPRRTSPQMFGSVRFGTASPLCSRWIPCSRWIVCERWIACSRWISRLFGLFVHAGLLVHVGL